MRIQTLAKLKEVVDELEAAWQPHLARIIESPGAPTYTSPSKEAIQSRDNFGAANELYVRFLMQFSIESRKHLQSIGMMPTPKTFLAQKAEEEE